MFFQQIEEWFDALSKQLTTLAVGSQPQNYHPNPCFVEEEEDLDIEQEGYDIKEDNEYIERVCLVNWDSPPIYDDCPEDFSQREKIKLNFFCRGSNCGVIEWLCPFFAHGGRIGQLP